MNLRWTLSLAFAAVIVLALTLAGLAFVALKRGEREQQTLEHLAAVAPQVTLELRAMRRAGAGPEQVTELVGQAGREAEVRVLLVGWNNVVTEDSEGGLGGATLDVPTGPPTKHSLYRTWTGRGAEDERLVFLYVPPLQFLRAARGAGEPVDRIVLAVPEATVAGAWRDLLPSLAWAGIAALVISLIVAALLARSIARPLVLLTRASAAMAQGHYDQEIPVRRRDEVGRLAHAFNVMAREVGRSHIQMRALIANVSHDLKTPLTSILGFSQALHDRTVEGPEASAEMGGIIHQEAERVQSLVDDLLFLSEIEARQVPLQQETLDLATLTTRAVRRFVPRFEERGITLTAEPAAPVLVRGDAAKLERILDNLLDNALKYTPAGGQVSVRIVSDDGVTVTVFNSGSFIPPQDLPRIFDRFERLDRARSGPQRGSGLGLAIARELAELHDGTLEAASDQAGTTLRLRLPTVYTDLRPQHPEVPTASPAQQPG